MPVDQAPSWQPAAPPLALGELWAPAPAAPGWELLLEQGSPWPPHTQVLPEETEARRDLQWHPAGIWTTVPSMQDLQGGTSSLQSSHILRYSQISWDLMIWLLKNCFIQNFIINFSWDTSDYNPVKVEGFFTNTWQALSKFSFFGCRFLAKWTNSVSYSAD